MTDNILKIAQLLKPNTAALIYTETARRYLTGFSSSLGYLFITQKSATAFFDGRYIEAAKKRVYSGINVLELVDLKAQVSELLNGVEQLYIESENTYANGEIFSQTFGLNATPNKQIDAVIQKQRQIKTADEIECILKAQSFAEKAFEDILHFIKPGVTEKQIAAELEYKMKLYGSDDVSFKTIAITGKKTSMPHGEPDNTSVKSGDFVTMDFGAMYNGYHSDMTRTVAVGNPSDQMKNVYDLVLRANLAALDVIREGVSCFDADKAARDVILGGGYAEYFNHSTGHGVGLNIHEAPNLSPKSSQTLECGQVVTVEPGIYLPQKFGVRIEDMVEVTKYGINNLTKTNKSLIIL